MRTLLITLSFFLYSQTLFPQTPVQGTIDGQTWTPAGSPYIMVGDLFIANLVIEPGVTVIASGDYEIEIAGLMTAIGTEQDSIIFTKADSIAGWQGLFFNFTTFQSSLRYCKIAYSTNSGIRVLNSTPLIENCTFLNNSGVLGGGIDIINDLINNSEFILKLCEFTGNTSSSHGGAVHVFLEDSSTFVIDSTNFQGNIANFAQANGNIVGGALYMENGNSVISNSYFTNNRSNSRCSSTFGCNVTARGGAIYIESTGNSTIRNCIFQGNQSDALNSGNCFFGGTSKSYGGAIYVAAGSVSILNCILASNLTTHTNCNPSDGGGGLYVNGGTVTASNCTIVENADATGVECNGGTLDVMNSIIYFNNSGGAQVGNTCTITYSDVQLGYTGTGNIDANPVFIDSSFHLSSISPCVDAGNPDTSFNDLCFPPSLGTEINDMGAYGGPWACNWDSTIIVGLNNEGTNIVNQYTLDQNYPNPFNPSTTIRFSLPGAAQVKLTVFNVLGQQVAELLNERKPAGEHSVTFDARNLSSGVYYYRLEAGDPSAGSGQGFREVRKMVLMR